MKTRFLLCAFCLLAIAFVSGCSKPRKDDFFNITFEIITTADVNDPYPTILTRAGLETPGAHTNFRSGKKWSYSTSFESSYRPLVFGLNAQNVRLTDPGKVTLNLYVNNSLVATTTRATSVLDGKHTVTTEPAVYIVN